MDAPLITRDPSANTTDVYAFVDPGGQHEIPCGRPRVYPHEEPGIGPNAYNFDDNVLYEIHVATGRDLKAGKPTISYQFEFNTTLRTTEPSLSLIWESFKTSLTPHRTSFRHTLSPSPIGTPRPCS